MAKPNYILGISCFYHDAGVALLCDGKLIACAEEERFTRVKHDSSFPHNAIKFCLDFAGIKPEDLAAVGFYEKPFIKFERMLEIFLGTAPKSYVQYMQAIPVWLREKLWIPLLIRKSLRGYEGKIYFSEHHLAHAASSFFVSPYEEAAILTLDAVGEWATAVYGVGKGNKIEIWKELHYPNSLGLLYSALTYYLGFKVNSAEYKIMGAAPYGRPVYADKILALLDLREDGSFRMKQEYFSYAHGLKMISKKFEEFFGAPPRDPEGKMEQKHWDLAASIQKVTEEIILRMVRHIHKETGLTKLCLAGGVALNCVANSRILNETPFKELFIQPAAGDAGGAVGIAYIIYHMVEGNARTFVWPHAFWGPEYSRDEIKKFLDSAGVAYHEFPDREGLLTRTVEMIEEQKTIGWFQGRMEFGPRALGSRSIIADARNAKNRDIVNLKIKFRESFRPFAPSVIWDRTKEFFDINVPSPYMLLVAQVKEDKRVVPAITHVDGSARLQTVDRESNPLYYDLIRAFGERTGVPIIINTSFNVRGEPIVCSPEDAFRCFCATAMDALVLGPFVLYKEEMPPGAKRWAREYEKD